MRNRVTLVCCSGHEQSCVYIEEHPHLAARVSATTSAHHGVPHRVTPPAAAGAGLMVNHGQVGLLQLGRQVTTSYIRQKEIGEHGYVITLFFFTYIFFVFILIG